MIVGLNYSNLGLNDAASRLANELISDAARLRVIFHTGQLGECLIDVGSRTPGGLEAGRRLAEICLSGLGHVQLLPPSYDQKHLTVSVHTSHPVAACLVSQYAGWSVSDEVSGNKHCLMSGPGRAVAAQEPLLKELQVKEQAHKAIFALETSYPLSPQAVETIASQCQLSPKDLVFIYAPVTSLAGTVQVTARVLEVALHKAHALGFPLSQIVDGAGNAPLPPPSPNFITAMGRTNDAIIFGGRVQLFVIGAEADAKELANSLPSCASKQFGKKFANIFQEVGCDFYKIDPMLFSPAVVTVTALETGRNFSAGTVASALLTSSFK